jgi:hypothetical protein
MIDATALLWRLELRSASVGNRWQKLAACWEPFAEHSYYAFNDAHAVMAFVAAGRTDVAHRAIAAMERKAAGSDTNAMMTRDVGLPLARGVAAFADGRYGDAIALLQPIRTIANRFGGSDAQRDVIHLTLVEAALRSRNSRLARALIAERTQLKPSSPFNWQLTARSMDLNGDSAGAAKALESAEARTKAQFGVHRAYA